MRFTYNERSPRRRYELPAASARMGIVFIRDQEDTLGSSLRGTDQEVECTAGNNVISTDPSRNTQLQLVNTSPMGTRPVVSGGKVRLSSSGSSRATWVQIEKASPEKLGFTQTIE